MLANRRRKDVFTFLGGFVWVLGALAKVISINIVFQIQIRIVGGMGIMCEYINHREIPYEKEMDVQTIFFLRPILEIIAYLLTRERKGTETFHKALVQPPSVVGCDLPVNFLPRQRSEPFSMCFSIIFSSIFLSLLIPCVAFASF